MAPVEEIAALPGVGLALALQLTLWRPYVDWLEVERVPGFDWQSVETLRADGAVLRAE